MNMKSMVTPRTRYEFERNFHLVAEQLRNRQIVFASGMKSADSLRKVRMLPNRRIDFLSVDEAARLHANMTANFQLEEEM
jgi:hypothetical protein